MAKTNSRVIPGFGIHPWFALEPTALEEVLTVLEARLAEFPRAVVGEIGLDRSGRGASSENQASCFDEQINLAVRCGRQAVLHCVKSWGWLMDRLAAHREVPPLLLHGYSGSLESAQALISRYDVYFSYGGLTHARQQSRQCSVIGGVPSSRLLVETDYHYEPSRETFDKGLRSLRQTIEVIASIKCIPVEEITAMLDENISRFLC